LYFMPTVSTWYAGHAGTSDNDEKKPADLEKFHCSAPG